MQCDIEVPENLRSKFINFPPLFKNTIVSKKDIADLMKNYAQEETLLSETTKMLIARFTLKNETLFTPLLLFNLQLGLVCTVLLSTLKRKLSTVLCSQQWKQEAKVSKIQTRVSSQEQ